LLLDAELFFTVEELFVELFFAIDELLRSRAPKGALIPYNEGKKRKKM
jgi:hypothetical protein